MEVLREPWFIPMILGAVLFVWFGAYLADWEKRENVKLQKLAASIEKTKFIDSSHTTSSKTSTSVGKAVVRGAVGGAMLGPVGMGAGIASAQKTTTKEKHTTTFMVWYKNGERIAETVDNESGKYKIFMDKLDI